MSLWLLECSRRHLRVVIQVEYASLIRFGLLCSLSIHCTLKLLIRIGLLQLGNVRLLWGRLGIILKEWVRLWLLLLLLLHLLRGTIAIKCRDLARRNLCSILRSVLLLSIRICLEGHTGT